MKLLTLITFLCLASCNGNQKNSIVNTDSALQKATSIKQPPTNEKKTADTIIVRDRIKPASKIYSNKRFRNVTVEKLSATRYRLKGEGQIFEASFSWVIEDGHDELQHGYTMTDAGAPEWGKFNFTVTAIKKRPNSSLHLILFETSAKDGSRQYELPILLE